MKFEDLLDHYKSKYAIAKGVKYTQTAVSHWKKVGYIPIRAQHRIELVTNGQFKADLNHTQELKKYGCD